MFKSGHFVPSLNCSKHAPTTRHEESTLRTKGLSTMLYAQRAFRARSSRRPWVVGGPWGFRRVAVLAFRSRGFIGVGSCVNEAPSALRAEVLPLSHLLGSTGGVAEDPPDRWGYSAGGAFGTTMNGTLGVWPFPVPVTRPTCDSFAENLLTGISISGWGIEGKLRKRKGSEGRLFYKRSSAAI